VTSLRRFTRAAAREDTRRPVPVPFLAPTVPPVEALVADYQAIVASGIFSNGGRMDRELVAAVEAWVGGGVFATTTSNCTAGLELAIRSTFLDRPKAIVPAFTFAAGPLSLVSAGHTPDFIDVEETSWQPSLDHARALLEHSARDYAGILLTANFGVAIECVAEWEALATKYELPLVIDSAAGFGSEYESGERLGARGTCEVFSIHATKMVAAGEGGIVTSCDPDLIARLNQAKNFGFGSERASVRWGTNAKLPELTAALALRQLDVLPQRLVSRRAVQAEYEAMLTPLGITFQPGALRSAPAFASALMPTAESRDTAMAALSDELIESRMYYNPPVHRQPFFSDAAPRRALEVTDELSARVISLPMSDELGTDVIGRIATTLSGVIAR
jgi:dTDP-4-amino-4,6-dideoxygalactose transaminase